MNVLVDGRPFIRSSAGISTVLRCVLVTWATLRQEDTLYVILAKPMHPSMEEYSFPKNVKWIEGRSSLFRYLPNSCFCFIMTPIFIKKYHIDIYYSPVPILPYFIQKRVKTIIGINDVVNIEYANTMYLKNKIANTLFYTRAVKKADVVWTISEYTKERIEHYFPYRRSKEIYVGCSVDKNQFRKLDISVEKTKYIREKYCIKGRFLLFVGSLEPRKNLPFLLEIIPKLYKDIGVQLVVVGAKGWKNSAISEVVEKKGFPKESVVFCGYVSNEDLVFLYNMAESFISASLNEGFGLPQLEAFMCGCPVVTAANSAMIEVAQGKSGGLLISGYDKDVWRSKIVSFLESHPMVKQEEFMKYDWNSIVKKLIHLYVN